MFNIELNGEWKMRVDGEEYTLAIPSSVQSCRRLGERFPSEAMPNGYLGSVEFIKRFEYKKECETAEITFKGVMPYATVYINDVEIGIIEYCQTAFTFDITKELVDGANTVRVVIEEKNLDLIGGMRFDVLQWSGIFDDVYISCFNTSIKEPEVSYTMKDNLLRLSAVAGNPRGLAKVEIFDGEAVLESKTVPYEDRRIYAEFVSDKLQLWSVNNPVLYTAKITVDTDSIAFKFGAREITCQGNRILINGKPFYAFGGGDEYFSPTISPLIDKDIIRQRYKKFKEMGFNFYRFHTHTPTQAELEVCDEMGVMVSVEIPIISNFSRITNLSKGFEILENYVIGTRTHPCIFDYCMGNEGIQLLVKDKNEHQPAVIGYNIIKKRTSNQLAMLCFGNQGEVPALPTDIMTPHLWSQEFRWAYDGLTKTPWGFLEGALQEKPCIVHEFGKYGVWPDDREDEAMPENGYSLSAKKHNDELFSNSGMAEYRDRIIKNSRKLSVLCAKTAFEAMRRQPSISGYIYWTMFRMGLRCGGLCDDMGVLSDCEPSLLKNGVNAPLGIFADRDFYGRTFAGGEKTEFKITVSNFSEYDVTNGIIECTLQAKDREIQREIRENIACCQGEIGQKAALSIRIPVVDEACEFKLVMKLLQDGKVLAYNDMTLWAYPNEKINISERIVYFVHNEALKDSLEGSINNVEDIWNWISVLLGCVIPEYGFVPSDDKLMDYIDAAAEKMKPTLVICDRITEVSKHMTALGIPVLYIDNGGSENKLYPDEIPGNTFFDLNRFYAPFRSGWDEGNCATILEGELFMDNSDEDFADFRYYSSIQGTMPLMKEEAVKELNITEIGNVLHLIQRVKNKQKVSKNSTVYFEKMQTKKINSCVYYLDGKACGTKVALTSMKFFADAFGRYIFKRIIENLI